MHSETTLNAMGRGLGPKQQEMLGWLQQQWAIDVQPKRSELMDQFVVDSGTLWHWDRQQQGYGGPEGKRVTALYPERPELTPRPVAEAYRRALRTLVDRELVKVISDPQNFYRYTDPQADNPLRTVNNAGRHYETTTTNEECGRRREPEISASEKRRQALLQCLPTDGSWINIYDLTDAFWLAVGGTQDDVDKARELLAKCSWQTYRLQETNAYRWLRAALLQLQKAGKAEAGTIDWRSDEIVAKNETHANGSKVVAARLSVAQ